MSGSRQTDNGKYKIEVAEEAWTGLSSLSNSAQEKVTSLWCNHVQHTPAQRIPGKLKQLKGEYKEFFQFDISKSDRMLYTIDEANKTVYVEYIGPHPNWKKSRRGSIRS